MQFTLSPSDEAFRTEVRDWILGEFGPDWDGGEAVSSEAEYAAGGALMKTLSDKGWLAMSWPKEYGGGGATYWQQLIFKEEMAYHRVPVGSPVGIGFAGPTIIIYGTEEQKQRYLPPTITGDMIWCQGFSEPGSGSDLASLQTRAVRDGDHYVVNGQKIWTSFAHYADAMILLARTDTEAPKHRGISYFLVDMKTPGITVRPLIDMSGAHFFNEVFFEDVHIPADALLGTENRGWYQAATTLDFERSSVAGAAALRRSLEDLVRALRERGRLSREALAELADIRIGIEIGRMLSYRVVSMQSAGMVPNQEASVGKLFLSELGQRYARTGLKLLGLSGQLVQGSKYVPLQGRYADNVMTTVPSTIAGGTSEIQRNIIATRGLGLPRG
ncbi:MAG: acyl-CoA dehydrogenase family protein [Dehalococcoidia bacterium]|nr:acyl-CoA dehydrogenase family protein [Dehalococcoidia bacterium]